MHVLHLDSSILGQHSVSRVLSSAVVDKIKAVHLGMTIEYHDLAERPLVHLSSAHIAVLQGMPVAQEPHIAIDLERGDAALQALFAADVVVIGVAMYNFTISTQLKAWIDRIVVAGKTFRYTETGAEGFLGGKRVILCLSRGSVYSGDAPAGPLEFAERYLKAVLGFIGITDVSCVVAEGLSISPASRDAAIAKALEDIACLAV